MADTSVDAGYLDSFAKILGLDERECLRLCKSYSFERDVKEAWSAASHKTYRAGVPCRGSSLYVKSL